MKSVDDLAEFNEILKTAGDKLVVVDFFATWCGPCRMIAPKLEAMSKTYTDVIFLKVDVDEAEDVAQKYDISAMPTFKFFKHEKEASLGNAEQQSISSPISQFKLVWSCRFYNKFLV